MISVSVGGRCTTPGSGLPLLSPALGAAMPTTAATRSCLTRAVVPTWTTMNTPSTAMLQLLAVSPFPDTPPAPGEGHELLGPPACAGALGRVPR